jgi:hypothetical protein
MLESFPELNTNFADPEVTFNYIEAVFWIITGIVIFVFGRQAREPLSRLRLPASVLLLLFGVSDVIEAQTGAWWRPFWLLVWKGLCVIGLAWCLWKYRQIRQRLSAAGKDKRNDGERPGGAISNPASQNLTV